MKLTAFQFLVWAISLVTYFALTVIVAQHRRYRRWPFLFGMCLFEITFNLVIVCLSHNYRGYFYTYWISEIVRALLGLGIVFDIIRAIPGVRLAPRNLVIGFIAASSLMTAGSAWLASSGGIHTFHLTMMAMSLERCIAVTWGMFAVSLFCALGFCGMAWTRTPLRMATAFLVLTLTSGATAYAVSTWINFASKIYDVFDFCTIGVWISWSVIMHHERENEVVSQSDGVLARSLIAKHIRPQIERGKRV
jgi:hypothetical protein